MAQHNNLGIAGEQYSSTELIRKGYIILEKNWKYRKNEIDLIVRKDNVVAFVEVKTRSNTYGGPPESHVSFSKQKKIVNVAQAYIEEKDIKEDIRFDIIAIVMNNKETIFNHIEDAFYPI